MPSIACYFFFQAEDGIRDVAVTGVQTCALPISEKASDRAPLTLLVGNLLASHLYREDHIVYSGAGEQMGTYEYQRWAEPPTEMVQEVLLRALRSSGRYRAVYAHRSNINGDFLLRGRIYDFKEVSGSSMTRSEEHTSELQSRLHLVCRLLLEKQN